MGIVTSSEIVKNILTGISVIEIDQADISEAGVFLLYDGATPVDTYTKVRRFALLIAGFSMDVKSGVLALVEQIEGFVCTAGARDTDIEYKGTHPVVVADGGLFIYRVDVEIIDIDLES